MADPFVDHAFRRADEWGRQIGRCTGAMKCAIEDLEAIRLDLIEIADDIVTTAGDIQESNIIASIAILRENYKALGDVIAELSGSEP